MAAIVRTLLKKFRPLARKLRPRVLKAALLSWFFRITTAAPKRPPQGNVAIPAFPAGDNTANIISRIPSSAEYLSLVERFTDYPEKSYMGPPFRATLFAMIRVLQPSWAVEIGTLFAGSSEIIAGALAANDKGKFTTVDPFGAKRVPRIIATWPKEFRRIVDFKPINSMQLFMNIESGAERPDFIFIDGNHDYEYALFDLQNSARYLKRGGVIVLDNYCDSGVRQAANRFEADNPAWQVVTFAAHPQLGESYEALNTLYRVYVAPSTVSIGKQMQTFTQPVETTGVRGIDLKFAEPSPGGRLDYKIYLRTFPYQFHLGIGEMDENPTEGTMRIVPGSLEASAQLRTALVTMRPLEGFHRRCEINLSFEADDGRQNLILADDPSPAELRPGAA